MESVLKTPVTCVGAALALLCLLIVKMGVVQILEIIYGYTIVGRL